MKVEQAPRLEELKGENTRLKHAVADLTLDNLMHGEAVEGNFSAPTAAGGMGRSSAPTAAGVGTHSIM
ncbi:MAG: hypothetical protein JSU59_06875 [Nitrospirota bacterium]|nr:MAG: hypothetical protein JSU59_06875 [Nitrospirota bacterium]